METNYGPVVIEDNNTGVPQFESAMEKYLLDDNRDRVLPAVGLPVLGLNRSIHLGICHHLFRV